MDIEGGKTYGKHKLKVLAYIKAKRLIRKQNKTFSNREAGAAMAMMARGGNDVDEEEIERIREEREERKEKNREWRERKERERRRQRGELSEDEDTSVSGSTSTITASAPMLSELMDQLSCTSCKDGLTGKVWQCQVGHPVCKNCVDKSWLQGDDISDSVTSASSSRKSSKSSISSLSSLDRFSNISDNSVKDMIENMSEQELLDLLESSSTTSSNVTFSGPTLTERNIKEINWFKNSINIRKDAIAPYRDYHIENDGNIFTIEDSDEEEGEGEEEQVVSNWDVMPKDEVELKHDSVLKKAQELSLDSSVDQDSGNETQSDSSQVTFSAPKPVVVNPIDWFKGTITVKKDVIRPYEDYHEEEEEVNGNKVTFKEDVEYISGAEYDTDDDSLDSASVLEKRILNKRSKICRDCEAPIIGRNIYLENLARTVFQK